MKWLLWVGIIIGAAFLAFALYVRFSPLHAERYNQSPKTAESDGKPHEYRLVGEDAPVFDIPAEELAQKLDAYILSQPRTVLATGYPKDLRMTYVQRTAMMGYPDYISIEIDALGENQSRLNILSRSRFGRDDFGVNRARVEDWVRGIKRISEAEG